ncbi:hypothetical protein [Nocardia salmonicida]|uniref:hypothetical protein n=1 Tax=Nocardia salmonicida TaxID=53431 RepID=UPI0007A371DA|nr:hypothetical protein [Nocardia salmonicida]
MTRWQHRTDTYTGHPLPRIPFSNSPHLVSGLVIRTDAAGSGWTGDGLVTVDAGSLGRAL